MILKSYQAEALDYVEKFLRRCRETGKIGDAYAETTEEWRFRLLYRPLPTMKQVPYICLRIPTGGGKTLVASHAIGITAHELLHTEHALCSLVGSIQCDP